MKLSPEHQTMIRELHWTTTTPGTVIADFTLFLAAVEAKPVPLSKNKHQPSQQWASELNHQLTKPDRPVVKRPLTIHYPSVLGLYLLSRTSGLCLSNIEGDDRPHLTIDKVMMSQWLLLNPAEQYFSLLEAWIVHGHPIVIGEQLSGRDDRVLGCSGINFLRHDLFTEDPIEEDCLDIIPKHLGRYNLALLALFGLATLRWHDTNKLTFLQFTPLGTTLFNAFQKSANMQGLNIPLGCQDVLNKEDGMLDTVKKWRNDIHSLLKPPNSNQTIDKELAVSLKPFTFDLESFESDPDECNEALEDWLETFFQEYHQSSEYLDLPVKLQKSGGQVFYQFMELSLNHLGKDLIGIDKAATKEIMTELLPRKFICPDNQVRIIIPELIACWRCLQQTIDGNSTSPTLNHASSVITYLQSIEKNYPQLFNKHSIHSELLSSFMNHYDTNDESSDWLIDLIDDAVENLETISKSPEPPKSWLQLYDYASLSAFFYEICMEGIDAEEESEAIIALLSFALNNLFIHIRQGEKDAIDFWEETEKNIISAFHADELDDEVMPPLLNVLSNYRQYLSDAFIAFTYDWQSENNERHAPDEEPTLDDLNKACLGMLNDAPDEFAFAELWLTQMGFLPAKGIAMIVQQMLELGHSIAGDYLALLILDERNDIARTVAETLANNPHCITPLTLDRLIRIRNWLPKEVQQPVDQLIRNARKNINRNSHKKNINAHIKTPVSPADIDTWMSAVDGSGAQGVLAVLPDRQQQGQFRMVNFVFKEAVGIVDIVVSPPESRNRLESIATMVREQLGVLEKVSSTLIFQQIPIFIRENLKSKVSISPDLVQALEQLDVLNWNPEPSSINNLYAALPGIPKNPSEADITAAQTSSEEWLDTPLGDSWLISKSISLNFTPGGSMTTTIHSVCDEYLENQRVLWQERMQRMTLWATHSDCPNRQKQAKDFSIISWLLGQDIPARDIKLMEGIARRSI